MEKIREAYADIRDSYVFYVEDRYAGHENLGLNYLFWSFNSLSDILHCILIVNWYNWRKRKFVDATCVPFVEEEISHTMRIWKYVIEYYTINNKECVSGEIYSASEDKIWLLNFNGNEKSLDLFGFRILNSTAYGTLYDSDIQWGFPKTLLFSQWWMRVQ